MSVNIRYPNITGNSEKEQMAQVKSYLYQLVGQLNYALSLETQTASATDTESAKTEAKAGEVQYSDLRALLAQELQRAENLLNQIETDLANGKFNGPPGADGKDGADGVSVTHSWEGTVLTITSAAGTSSSDLKGEKGDQYVLTDEDKAEIVQAVLDALNENPEEEE